ncbi:MogA/MoaB family molybdenum cofactor biosynthesis protein [soil metagenome]
MTSPSTEQHRAAARDIPPVRAAVLTISDTRTMETDTSGRYILDALGLAGHLIATYEILKDEPALIRDRVHALASGGGVDVILTNGGTGIAPRDGTFEAVSGLLDKTLPGFGEIFRMLSWQEVGPAAMLSRATAGLHGQTLIFTMPGSSNAVQLAMTKLILPELGHLVWEMKKKGL